MPRRHSQFKRASVEHPRRPVRKESKVGFFEPTPDWQKHWWGMPKFVMGRGEPVYQIIMNFMTREDIEEFARRLGVQATERTKGIWFPPQDLGKPSEWCYVED